MRIISFYLPQYYPTETNDRWYGKGFTEWTNVAKAKPLYKGHYEPHIPADLGFYDLRVAETRRAQAKMAQEYGIEAFCYWTYWFGNGVTELDGPLWDMYNDESIKISYCLGWANCSWEKKFWNNEAKGNLIIQEQRYLGKDDYKKFFYRMLPLFKDKRYFRVDNKLFFIIHYPLDNRDEVKNFVECWRGLAEKEGLTGFYFAAADFDSRSKEEILDLGIDAIYNMDTINIHHRLSVARKVLLKIKRELFGFPTVFNYKDAIKYMVTDDCKNDNVIPVVAPNWDHSPRSGRNAIILKDCEPRYFKKVLLRAKKIVSTKKDDHQIVIVQSWNEWGEGNHLEPDLKYGKGYLEAIADVMGEREN
ncbi:glycosyltransferase WbsX family protein [Butyrivibrio sp. VCB2001]|uniref:glycosyltransferase WbsX family protein n=1 Tax=Butyrivibrio sp. VCB2001 TaxID=1280667 RepID=UPI00040043B5|nr:glycoside hydrolase family 99-like domain-containing protein [Butyrivibrio sp. VCB2001]